MGTKTADPLPPGMELRETHISLVFLGGDEVFKVKKLVSLEFLDFSTIGKRHVEASLLSATWVFSPKHGSFPAYRGDEPGFCAVRSRRGYPW